MSAEQIVELLNDVFSSFDELVDRTAWRRSRPSATPTWSSAACPRPTRADHAGRVAEMALAMPTSVARCRPGWRVRSAAASASTSGPVVAGVIGKKKFIYDVWGDTVNTASRMESHGVPGRIQVHRPSTSGSTGRFEFEPRGTIDVKGKGPMTT